MTSTLRLLATAGLLGALSLPAVAEDRQTTPPTKGQSKAEVKTPSPPSPTMKDLLGQGYEVKAVTLIPHDIVTRGGSTTDVDAMMFLLEKGAAIATCYTDFASYANGSFVTLACTEYK